ncbi:MAG: hypothetical protein ABH859_04510 [Pseudomonadota bacterium]
MKKARKYNKLALLVIFSTSLFVGCGSDSTGTFSSTNGDDLGSGSGVEFSNEYSSPAELGKGDLMYVNFGDSNQTTVDFTGVDQTAKFFLIAGSVSETSGTSMVFSSELAASMEKSLDVVMSNQELNYEASDIFSAWIRAAEFDLAENGEEISQNIGLGKSMGLKAVGLGDPQNFRVLASLTSTSSYVTVTAQAKYIGSEIILYVDNELTENDLNQEEINELGVFYDDIAQREQALLGEASDVDSDGKFSALITPQINRLGEMGGGIITGYFFSADLYVRNSSNPVSNEMEIVYMLAPDPDGEWGYPISKQFALSNLLMPVFPHELQHAISYNQHVFVNNGSPEESWLNEGMSHFIEDWAGVGLENPSRYSGFLASPSSVSLVNSGSPNLLERGAAYLFLRYLYEQSADGAAFLARLEDTYLVGVDNLVNAFNGPSGFSEFYELMARWTIALALTNQGITQDSRYIYQDRVLNSETGNWEGVCLICEADDNRGTVLTGVNMTTYLGSTSAVIAASAARFFDIQDLDYVYPEMQITGTASNGNFAVLIRQE